jgi:hypothetical protein
MDYVGQFTTNRFFVRFNMGLCTFSYWLGQRMRHDLKTMSKG